MDLYLDAYAGAVNQANWLINDGAWGFTEVSDWLYDADGNLLNYPHLFSTFGDYDMDGDLDLALWKYTSSSDGFPIMQYRVLRNDINPAGGWLQVRVTNDLGRSLGRSCGCATWTTVRYRPATLTAARTGPSTPTTCALRWTTPPPRN